MEDNHKSIVSGGLVFCCSETKEFYEWLFNILFNLFQQIKCVISDEDTSIISALFEYNEVYHILCSKHKIANIYKHINIFKYDEVQKQEFDYLLHEFFILDLRLHQTMHSTKFSNAFPKFVHILKITLSLSWATMLFQKCQMYLHSIIVQHS